VPWPREGRQCLLALPGPDRTTAGSTTEGTQVERKGWGQLCWALDQRILREFGTKCFNSNTDVGYLESTEPAERQSEITRSSGLPSSKNNCHVKPCRVETGLELLVLGGRSLKLITGHCLGRCWRKISSLAHPRLISL